MRAQNLLGSKLMVPKAGTDIRIRPEVRDKLEKIPAYPVTVVQAGAGYGKNSGGLSFPFSPGGQP